jgi:hypothetical protein
MDPHLASFESTEGGYTPDGSGTAPIGTITQEVG